MHWKVKVPDGTRTRRMLQPGQPLHPLESVLRRLSGHAARAGEAGVARGGPWPGVATRPW